MKFEWDDKKAASNLLKHGIAFDDAVGVFNDSMALTFPDPDHSVGEIRLLTFGYSKGGKLLAVIHTERGQNIRIVSARKVTRHERGTYEQS